MKLIPGSCCTLLLLSVLIPKEAEGLAPLIMTRLGTLAAKKGWTLTKMTYYAECDTVNEPPEIECPSDVYGIGMNPEQAKLTARLYAAMFGEEKCALYVAKCRAKKFMKGVVQVVKKLPGIIKKIPGLGK